MESRQSEELKKRIKDHKGSVVVEGFGPGLFGHYALGKVSFIKPTVENIDAMPKLLNELDEQEKGRQTSALVDYFVGGPFILSLTGKDAQQMHHAYSHSLNHPKDYITFTLEEAKKILVKDQEFLLNDFIRKPAMAALVHGMFNVQLDQSPDLEVVLGIFEKMGEGIHSDFYNRIVSRLIATYFPLAFNLKSDFRAARNQYIATAETFLTNQAKSILEDINSYASGNILSSFRNVLTHSVLELIKINHPEYKNEPTRFRTFLSAFNENDLREYLENHYIRAIPGSVTAALNIVVINSCSFVALAKDTNLRDVLRKEINEMDLFYDDDSTRLQRCIESDRRENGILHRIYLESCRREDALKSPEELEFDSDLWRYTDKDISFGNEIIPKNSAIAVMNGMPRFDKKTWDHPEEFQPERFVKNDNQVGNKNIARIPESIFSYGKRVCPAHKITEYISKIFLCYMVENYNWTIEKSNEKNAKPKIQLLKRPEKNNKHEFIPSVKL